MHRTAESVQMTRHGDEAGPVDSTYFDPFNLELRGVSKNRCTCRDDEQMTH